MEEDHDAVSEKVVRGMQADVYGVDEGALAPAAAALWKLAQPQATGPVGLHKFLTQRQVVLDEIFSSLDADNDNLLQFSDLALVDSEAQELLWCVLDQDQRGSISRAEFKQLLLLAPLDPHNPKQTLEDAYNFFSELAPEDCHAPQRQGFGYFWAGGLAGVISRTCTAPFDRLKVFLIAFSGKSQTPHISDAMRIIYKNGGIPGFFVGNGLNILKVFPESAIKFGGFEMAKRLFATIEGVEDPADLSRAATFFAGGLGGMISQLCVYPLDTLKFRVQCNSVKSSRGQISRTIREMVKEPSSFYRGLYVGVLGIFPFAALDLGLFSLLKSTYISRKAQRLKIDPSEVQMGNMVVLSMGAFSGSIGASVVYPINLIRTRIQTQNTASHPYRYAGFLDCMHQTFRREGWRGYFRGLGPNLAKVAPSVSISYLVYENAKGILGLE